MVRLDLTDPFLTLAYNKDYLLLITSSATSPFIKAYYKC